MSAVESIRRVVATAAVAVSVGLFSAAGSGMPMPAGVETLGRSSDWIVKHGLAASPKIAVGRDVNDTQGRASALALPASKAGAASRSVTIDPRSVAAFGRA